MTEDEFTTLRLPDEFIVEYIDGQEEDEVRRRREENFRVWTEARDALDDGRLAVARALAQRYVDLEPDVKVGRLLLAEVLTQLRSFDTARQLLEGLGSPKKPRARAHVLYAWAQLCERSGHHAEAEQHYRNLAQVYPEETDGWILLGACLAQQGKLEEAASIHGHATTLRGDRDEAFLNLALVLRALGRLVEAAEAARAALEICPDYPAARSALADIEAALKLEPSPPTPT